MLFYEKIGGNMKPQRAQRVSLCSQKEYPLKEIIRVHRGGTNSLITD
jgi:hypothetical protein